MPSTFTDVDTFKANTLAIVADCNSGRLSEEEARGRLAGEFSASRIPERTVDRWDGTGGRLPMCVQTKRDIAVGVCDLIVDRTLDAHHRSSFDFSFGNYAGWARNYAATATQYVAKQMAIGSSRMALFDVSTDHGAKSAWSDTGATFGEEESERAWEALDRYEQSAARQRASSRLQVNAQALHTLADTPPLARLPRPQRERLRVHLWKAPDAAWEAMTLVARGGQPAGALGALFEHWGPDAANRFLTLGTQELRREAVRMVVEAAVADYPRPLRDNIKALTTRLTALKDGSDWRKAVKQLVAAFIDTECEAVSALSTAPNSQARIEEHRRNNEQYSKILADAAKLLECSPNMLEMIMVRSAINLQVVVAPPARLAASRS